MKQKATNDVADYLENAILDYVRDGKSPVAGERKNFIPLQSKEYKKKKLKIAGNTKANLELEGDLLDDFSVNVEKTGKIVIGYDDDASQETLGKADGHNNFSGKSKLPRRRFIPSKKQKFRDKIERDIKEIIAEYEDDSDKSGLF